MNEQDVPPSLLKIEANYDFKNNYIVISLYILLLILPKWCLIATSHVIYNNSNEQHMHK